MAVAGGDGVYAFGISLLKNPSASCLHTSVKVERPG